MKDLLIGSLSYSTSSSNSSNFQSNCHSEEAFILASQVQIPQSFKVIVIKLSF